MPRTTTSFKPGQSGNPKGRPKKERTLTKLLETTSTRKFLVVDEEIAAKKAFAGHVWEGLATGQINFGDNRIIKLDGAEYIALAKFVLGQVDGPPKAEVDVTTGGAAIKSSPTLDDMKGLLQMMGQREKSDSTND